MSKCSSSDVNVLPTRENSLFKKILKCYDQKQYKNGLKFAKIILSSFPNHGETLSMKGLILNCMGRKQEAYDHVRRGLRNNLRSHVCWHVYGILQRGDRKYDEAVKCYRNALKWDRDNVQVLRDLSHLQIQLRDLEGYRDTKYQLFILRPTQRVSWVGYAMAQHLVKNYDMALQILETFGMTLNRSKADFELSEFLLYENMVLREAGHLERAVDHIQSNASLICDKLTVLEIEAELYLKLNEFEKANQSISELISRNPENCRYFELMSHCVRGQQRVDTSSQPAAFPVTDQVMSQVTPQVNTHTGAISDGKQNTECNQSDHQIYADILGTYSSKYPKAHAPRKLQLYTSLDAVRDIGAQMLQEGLRRGAPPLFNDMLSVYKQFPASQPVFESIMLRFERNLRNYGLFHCDTDSNSSNLHSDEQSEANLVQNGHVTEPFASASHTNLHHTTTHLQPADVGARANHCDDDNAVSVSVSADKQTSCTAQRPDHVSLHPGADSVVNGTRTSDVFDVKHMQISLVSSDGPTQPAIAPSSSDIRKMSSARESPCCLMWTYYYLAQHYDHLNDVSTALHYIDLAIEHTPTLIELLIFKAKIFKHTGNLEEACVWMDEVQAMDTADRYINSKAAKYMLRANKISAAEELCAKFTREGVLASEDLQNMQCMWYLTECALAHWRLGQLGEALKKCHQVDRHFTDIVEDQYDFVTYCLRRMTLRSYVNLLRLEDGVKRHPFYFKAAKCAINVYIQLFDKPLSSKSEEVVNSQDPIATDELKKLRSEMRKARRKVRQLHEKQVTAAKQQCKPQTPVTKKEDGPDTELDDYLDPEQLVKTSEPLEEAVKFLLPLQQLAVDRFQTHVLAFEIYLRKNKILLMLRAVLCAARVCESECRIHAQFHSMHVRLLCYVERHLATLSEHVRTVVQTLMSRINACIGANSVSAADINRRWIEQHQTSLSHTLHGLRMAHYLGNHQHKDVVAIFDRLPHLDNFVNCTWQEALDVYQAMVNGDLGDMGTNMAAAYKQICAEHFPYCTPLGGTLPPKTSIDLSSDV